MSNIKKKSTCVNGDRDATREYYFVLKVITLVSEKWKY